MNWNGEEYSKKLETLSDDTMRIVAELNTSESISKAADIIMKNKTESEIMKKLLELKAEMDKETGKSIF